MDSDNGTAQAFQFVKRLHQAMKNDQREKAAALLREQPWIAAHNMVHPDQKIDSPEKATICFRKHLNEFRLSLASIERSLISIITEKRSSYVITESLLTVVLDMAVDNKQGEIKATLKEIFNRVEHSEREFQRSSKVLLEDVNFLLELIDNNRSILDNIDWKESLRSAYDIIAKRRDKLVSTMNQEKDMVKLALDGYTAIFTDKIDDVPSHNGFYHNLLNDNHIKILNQEETEEESRESYDLPLIEDYFNASEGFEGYIESLDNYAQRLHGVKVHIRDLAYFSVDLLRQLLTDIRDPLLEHFKITTTEIIQERLVANTRKRIERGDKNFTPSLVSQLYTLLNGTVFAPISFDNFVDSLNNPVAPIHLSIEKDQMIKACYMVKQLAYALPPNMRSEWANNMLECLGIKAGTYRSKGYQCGAPSATEENKVFARRLNDMLISNGVELG